MSNRRGKRAEATRVLEEIAGRYDRRWLEDDPVRFAHRYRDAADREVVAFLSALLAFGNVKAIQASVSKVLDLLGPSPARFARYFEAGAAAPLFAGVGHRWVRGDDLVRLFGLIHDWFKSYGSVKDAFLAHYRPEDPDLGPMLEMFSKDVFSRLDKTRLSRGFRYFFPLPSDGSPCKRLNMFLRWVVRPADGIDLGLWPEIPPSKLIVPLDTHVYRFARRFGLSPYRTPRWEVARHVTDFLMEIDEKDPVRFDFPICHYGMEVGW